LKLKHVVVSKFIKSDWLFKLKTGTSFLGDDDDGENIETPVGETVDSC